MTLRRRRGKDQGVRKVRSEWTPMQVHYLKAHYSTTKNADLAKTLNKSIPNLIRKAREIGIESKAKQQARPKLMDRAEEIKSLYRSTKNIARIAEKYQVSYNTISRLLKRLGEC